jgi:hypothetical protein
MYYLKIHCLVISLLLFSIDLRAQNKELTLNFIKKVQSEIQRYDSGNIQKVKLKRSGRKISIHNTTSEMIIIKKIIRHYKGGLRKDILTIYPAGKARRFPLVKTITMNGIIVYAELNSVNSDNLKRNREILIDNTHYTEYRYDVNGRRLTMGSTVSER